MALMDMCLLNSGNRSEQFRCCFAMGTIRGTPRMLRHTSVQRALPKYFSNSFIFKKKIEKEGLLRDNPSGLGTGGPEFPSWRREHSCELIHAG